ncbi:MAG: hypothetical protein ACQESX_08660 [Bacteroidota bacterium]
MTDQSIKISAERKKDNLHIMLEGDAPISELHMLKDRLLRKTDGYERIHVVLNQPNEIRFSVLQMLLALRNTKEQKVDVSVETNEEQYELIKRAGFSTLFNIKD